MSDKCTGCSKSVYYNDPKITIGGGLYHATCARCATCAKKLTVANFATSGDRLLCSTHFSQEFSSTGGKYAGDERFEKKSSFD
mmetsp:Transcript_14139/g.18434  ORF Transcript_14139/g.18434 Transcript_14139/m.18434 type:complete len:83 (-) Transcript_14139:606-854(-)|eukprot:CAMPEP_0198145688 /NCGR_PEP_ID=MMETSP1443-20131203/24845_1 /TAXON_ID=186043 /ORGANISM="Entomoneis sp., Strain CCMP2396" /LENGTH=82 /DNA_ID=CAMNT_0043809389 /DNA_START=277 /DNA_END=528 /DNA_ORIENTATION=+